MLCCAVLCFAALCCVLLCCVSLRCAVFCCAVLCCVLLCCAMLRCVVLCCAMRRCAVLCCTVFSVSTLTTLVPLGAVDALLSNLSSENEEVRSSTAVALGYLSFDRTAARLMLVACRSTPGLYETLLSNLGNGKMAMEFVEDWKQTKLVGLPSERSVLPN